MLEDSPSLRIGYAGGGAVAAQPLPPAAYDDKSLCQVLADVRVNFYAQVIDERGVPSPAILSPDEKASALLAITARAAELKQATSAAPAPRAIHPV